MYFVIVMLSFGSLYIYALQNNIIMTNYFIDHLLIKVLNLRLIIHVYVFGSQAHLACLDAWESLNFVNSLNFLLHQYYLFSNVKTLIDSMQNFL